jgi:hypothetical protein
VVLLLSQLWLQLLPVQLQRHQLALQLLLLLLKTPWVKRNLWLCQL